MKKRSILALLLSFLTLSAVYAAETTALDLIELGNKHVGEDAKNKVVQIRSEKSVGGLTPNIWFVVYYDPDATFKATEVKFGGGKKMEVKRPMRVVERISGESALDLELLKIDSPKALKIAQEESLLENLKLTNAQLSLERREGVVVWRVRFWAQKARKPDETVDIGEVHLDAQKGKIVKLDLHPERVE